MFELTEEALVAASVTTVWADFTDPTRLAEWFWPARFEAEAHIDLAPRGHWQIRSAIAGLEIEARVLATDPPHSLPLLWREAREEHETDVEITFEEADDATRVIVRHSGFRSEEEREDHVEDWSTSLARLVARYAS